MATIKEQYLTDVEGFVHDYRAIMARAEGLQNRWGALLSSKIVLTDLDEKDYFEQDGSKLTALTSVVGNIGTLHTTYDAGIDTNFGHIA